MRKTMLKLPPVAVAGLLLAACGGGGVTETIITVKSGDAYRLADRTVAQARVTDPTPSAELLHTTFASLREATDIPDSWHLVDVDENHLEVQLWVPEKSEDESGSSQSATAHRLQAPMRVIPAEDDQAAVDEQGATEDQTGEESDAQVADSTESEEHLTGETVEHTTHEAETSGSEHETPMRVALRACISAHSGKWVAYRLSCQAVVEQQEDESASPGESVTTTSAAIDDSSPSQPDAAQYAGGSWSFSAGVGGPDDWAGMFEGCARENQSPIDLGTVEAVSVGLEDPVFRYVNGTASIEDDGKMLSFVPDQENVLIVDGSVFALEHVTLRSPSEHLINGTPTDLEMQLIHRSPDAGVLVVSVFANASSTPNGSWADVVELTRDQDGAGSFQPSALLPQTRRMVRYEGSLTHPPCDPVSWLMFNEIVALPPEQVDALSAFYPGQTRPAQPVGARVVLQDAS